MKRLSYPYVIAVIAMAALGCGSDEPDPPAASGPAILSLSPGVWPAGGGTTMVSVFGSNFGTGPMVELDGVERPVFEVTDSTLQFNMWAADVLTPHDIQVRVRDADGMLSPPASFRVADSVVPFAVDSITPIVPELAPGQPIVAWLNQAALPASVTPESVNLQEDGVPVVATATYDAATMTIRVGALAVGKTYQVAFTSSTRTPDGQGLLYSWFRSFFVTTTTTVTIGQGDSPSLTLGSTGSPTVLYRAVGGTPAAIQGLSSVKCTGSCTPGTAWSPRFSVDGANTGLFTASVAVPGTVSSVAALYQGGLSGPLKFGMIGGSKASLDSDGVWSALAVMPDGRYHGLYYLNGALEHRTCPSACITTAWSGGTVDAVDNPGSYSALTVDGAGRIHAVYRAEDGPSLRYATCVSPCVPSAWTTGTIGPDGSNPIGMSIAATAAGVAMSYYDATSGIIRYGACAASCAEPGQWSFADVASAGTGSYAFYRTSLAQAPSGEVVVAYQPTDGGLRLAACSANCTASSGWTVTVASRLQVDGYPFLQTSLKIDQLGQRHVVWAWGQGERQLRYGRF